MVLGTGKSETRPASAPSNGRSAPSPWTERRPVRWPRCRGQNQAIIATLIETWIMSAVDPHAWLARMLTAMIAATSRAGSKNCSFGTTPPRCHQDIACDCLSWMPPSSEKGRPGPKARPEHLSASQAARRGAWLSGAPAIRERSRPAAPRLPDRGRGRPAARRAEIPRQRPRRSVRRSGRSAFP